MARGIDGRAVFDSDAYCSYMRDRLASLSAEMGFGILAWVLMPNHLHLMVRTTHSSVSRLMHRLLTGFASFYNRSEERMGHVFQGRFKSIVVQPENYFRRLVRYIHLNPLKAGLVRSIRELGEYRWSGHRSILGLEDGFVNRDEVLAAFGPDRRHALGAYLSCLEKPDEIDENLLSSGSYAIDRSGLHPVEGSDVFDQVRCGFVLGDRDFALRACELSKGTRGLMRRRGDTHSLLREVEDSVTDKLRITKQMLRGGRRSESVSRARSILCKVCVDTLGMSKSDTALWLRLTIPSVTAAIGRAEDSDGLLRQVLSEANLK